MRNINELKISKRNESSSIEMIDQALMSLVNSSLGCDVPNELVKLLLFANGGHPELDSFLHSDGSSFAISYFHCMSVDENDLSSITYVFRVWQPVLDFGLIPFAKDGGGNQFVVDSASDGYPVYFCSNENGFKKTLLADSLDNFIDGLRENPDYI